MGKLFLASSSPRRRELLSQIGVPFISHVVAIDESVLEGESAPAYVERLARSKACAALDTLTDEPDAMVLGADTAVVLDGTILGKPRDQADSVAMLSALSGRSHTVLSAVAIACTQRVEAVVVSAQVSFRTLSRAEIDAYWASGEPQDKAGSYAIQGLGAVFVNHVQGSYSAVVGLPLCETADLLATFSIPCWQSLPHHR